MTTLEQKVDSFLALAKIAVVGVSLTSDKTGNYIYRKLKKTGKSVFPVHPKATNFDGERCYPDVKSIPGGVDGAVIVTRPEITEVIVRDCAEAGVKMVWMHQSLLKKAGSVSHKAVEFCRENGIDVIDGSCPMMHYKPIDFAHKCMGWMMRVSGNMPV